MKPIQNKYDFMFLFDCEYGNPNGDPFNGNLPRIDFEDGHGLVNNACLKRLIRDYVELYGYKNFIALETNLNRFIFEARQKTGDPHATPTQQATNAAASWMCEQFFDVRTFGGVMTTGANAGQLRGPVQIHLAKSVDPVQIIEMGIVRGAVAVKVKNAKTVQDYLDWETQQPRDQLHTMGRKSLIPYGLYVAKGHISVPLAQKTGFSEEDLKMLFQSIMNMFEHNRSDSKGLMTTQRLVVFKHVGDPTVPIEARTKQAQNGCAAAQKLLLNGQIVSITRTDTSKPPRAYADYQVNVDISKIPIGIEMLDLEYWDETAIDNFVSIPRSQSNTT